MSAARFNLYLCVALGLALAGGCKTSEEDKKKKEVSTIDLHIEVNQDGAKDNGPVSISRAHPTLVNIEKSPFLTANRLLKARVVDEPGGLFSIELKYNPSGTTILDMFTTANQGRRIAVFSRFGEERWLASPVIRRRITDGVFTFTPDATHEEAERIVQGLNNVAAEMTKMDKL